MLLKNSKHTKMSLNNDENLSESVLGWQAEQSGSKSLLNSGEERCGQVVGRACWIDWGLE